MIRLFFDVQTMEHIMAPNPKVRKKKRSAAPRWKKLKPLGCPWAELARKQKIEDDAEHYDLDRQAETEENEHAENQLLPIE